MFNAIVLNHVSLVDQIMWCKFSLSASLMLSVSGLTSTSWVIAVSSDDGENDGGGQHTQHIHNERGMGWRRERVAGMRGGQCEED